MVLAIQHSGSPLIFQADSSTALSILSRSAYSHLADEIKFYIEVREFVPRKTSRDQNRVAHQLANYSHTEAYTAGWMHSGPPCCEELVSRM